jgi:hypothetical protein
LRFLVVTLIVCAEVIQPAVARAQSRVTLIPSVSLSSLYDDNLFARTVGSSDQMTLLTPSIQASYERPTDTVFGLYSFDMQRSIDHPALNNVQARRHALMNTRHRESEKLTLVFDGSYDQTDTAGALSLSTGLLLGRVRADRWQVGPSMDYQVSPLTTVSARYDWTRERIEGSPSANEHVVRFNVAHQLSPRLTASLGYLGRHFVNGDEVHTSNAALAGWTYELAPFMVLTLLGGPRLASRGGVAPEIVAALARKPGHAFAYGLDYWRGESITLGVIGPVEVNSASARVTVPLVRKIDLGLHGGFFNSATLSQGKARVYHGEVVAAWTPIGPFIIAASYGADYQRGDVRTSLLSDETVVRHLFLLRLTAAPRLSRTFHPEDPLQPLGGPSNGANR